jgi:copper transport protein
MTAARHVSRWGRRRLAVVLALVATAVLLAAPTSVAEAHSGLLSTTPGSGAVMGVAPDSVLLRFSETVTPVAAAFQLFDPSGTPIAVDVTSVDSTVEVALPTGLVQGSYVLSWRVISADSHPISGGVPFSIGRSSTGGTSTAADSVSPPLDGAVGLSYVLAQTAAYLGLMAAVGLTLFQVVVLSPQDVSPSRERVLVGAIATTIIGHAALLPLTLLRSQGVPLSRIVDPTTLLASLSSSAGLALALVVLGCCAMLLRPVVPRPAVPKALAALGACLAVASVLPVGHTRTATPTWLVMTADVVHTLAGAMWFGGVIGLVLFLRATKKAGAPAEEAAGVVSRFSTLAGLLVVALGVTGVILAVLILGSVPALFETDYGRTLLVKLAFVGVIAVLAWWNKVYLVPAVRRVQPSQDQWRRLTGAVRDEAALLVAVVCVTALLVMQSPVVAPAPSPPPPATVAYSSALGSGSVKGSLEPARIGENFLEFDLVDSRGHALSPVALPTVSASLPDAGLGPLAATVEQKGRPGHYRATITLPTRGQWEVAMTVRVTKFEQQTATQVISVSS